MANVDRRPRVVVAGAGAFGTKHIRVLAGRPDAELVGIADTNLDRARQAAEDHGVPNVSADAAALISDLAPDGVVVATPGHTHRDLAVAALRAGAHVLVEKPVAMTAAEVDDIAAARGTATVLPGHILRFSRAHREVARIARSGALGPIMSVTSRRYRDASHIEAYPDIDPVFLTMIHDIDLALWLTGEPPERIWAARTSDAPRHGETRMTGITPSGTIWTLSTAWTFDTAATPPDRLEIVGERGLVEWDAGRGITTVGVELPPPVTDSEEELLGAELGHFIECIVTGEPSDVVTLEEARVGIAIAEEIVGCLSS